MRSRVALELNQKAVQAELKASYCRKAWRCGMTLEAYCKRFGIKGLYESARETEGVSSDSRE